jgi:hypothetical protein
MSTILPTPSYNPQVPIITSHGGKEEVYNNPNSPESILKRTTALQVQSVVDTKFDVNVPAHEGFRRFRSGSGSILRNPSWIVFYILFGVLLFLLTRKKAAKNYLYIGITTIVAMSFLLYIVHK